MAGTFVVWLLDERRATLERLVADRADEIVAHPFIAALVLFVAALPLLGVAIYLFRTGTAILRCRRFPPPGMDVVRDTPILTGRAAILRGRVVLAAAAAIVAASLGITLTLWWVIHSLGPTAG